ncbi:Amidohydrolase [Carbonactinospora thermoautotrophica]|nr:amidohydrolase family protein [Carbonactinospora thermoautotrophica]KWX02801.1 Amidohydrolase [Carbonactinospora thermoautotrophica]
MRLIHTAPVVLPIADAPIRDGAVAVVGDRVTAVGPRAEVVAEYPDARVRDWPGVLLPGLVNAHSHLQYSDFADLATLDLPFSDWIRRLTARRAEFTEAMWQESTRRGIHAMLRTGTTAAADVVTDPCVLTPTARSGLAGISYIEVVGADDTVWAKQWRDRLVSTLDSAPAGRRVGVSPHTLYTLGREVFRECVRMARERGLRVHPHLAESADESEYVLAGTGSLADWARRLGFEFELIREGGSGMTPTHLLDSIGGLGPDVHVAHAVHCDTADRAVLRERGTTVALCVRSNRLLRVGEPPVAAYLAEGNPIAIGTDSLASTPSLDLLEEAGALRELARRQGYDAPDLDRRLVEAATVGGARAMGLTECGVLRPGARADLAVFDVPVDGDPYRALLDHGPGRCVATVLAGRLVHRRTA